MYINSHSYSVIHILKPNIMLSAIHTRLIMRMMLSKKYNQKCDLQPMVHITRSCDSTSLQHDLTCGKHAMGHVAASSFPQLAASPDWHQCAEISPRFWKPAARAWHTGAVPTAPRCAAQLTASLRPTCGVGQAYMFMAVGGGQWARVESHFGRLARRSSHPFLSDYTDTRPRTPIL